MTVICVVPFFSKRASWMLIKISFGDDCVLVVKDEIYHSCGAIYFMCYLLLLCTMSGVVCLTETNAWSTETKIFMRLLTHEPYTQLRLIFDEYRKISGQSMEEAITTEFSGDLRNAMLTIGKTQFNKNRIIMRVCTHLYKFLLPCTNFLLTWFSFWCAWLVAGFSSLFFFYDMLVFIILFFGDRFECVEEWRNPFYILPQNWFLCITLIFIVSLRSEMRD